MSSTVLAEDWQTLVNMFPKNWRALAKETQAITRKLRGFADEESMMRILLLHIAQGYSLRETVTRAKLAHIADLSDVALLKRLRCAEQWFKALCLALLAERGIKPMKANTLIPMRLADGTTVKEPGKTGSVWRIHYSISLPDLRCDYFKLTKTQGEETAETFKQFPIKKGECIIGDRGYSKSQGIAYVDRKSAYVLVRVNTGALKFCTPSNKPFHLLEQVKTLKNEHERQQWAVKLVVDNTLINGRVCVIRKSRLAADEAIKKLKINASKKQKTLRLETLEFAHYVIIFTTLPPQEYPLDTILDSYRFRWQIELAFKRLKSLAGLGHLPKYDEASVKAWLYGKLFTGLLVEKLIQYAKTTSPWGYAL